MTYVATFGIFFAIYGVLAWRTRRRLLAIAKKRSDDDFKTFLCQFDGVSWRRDALEMAYADLASLAKMPVYRNDELQKTLGFLPEDLERVIERRANNLGISDIWHSRHVVLLPLKTVEDYVRLITSMMGQSIAGN